HANKGIPTGVTPGKTILLTQNVGEGLIFVIGGHPESTPGMRWIVPRMARYAHSQEIISYPSKWIRPEINNSAIMFTYDLRKLEKKLWWDFLNDTAEVQINAMTQLHQLRSRPAVRWTIGLLRDNNPQVRLQAAIILMKTEYTWALPDVQQALENEKNEDTKKQLQKTADFLSTF
ncbi:MAG: HEAT repeat domain-containing protein, partial [Candidatus Cloacimonadota bacterium]|nr:HEAT repeat domain-containing protein [Candidatus Cloacimonadota bacterium]